MGSHLKIVLFQFSDGVIERIVSQSHDAQRRPFLLAGKNCEFQEQYTSVYSTHAHSEVNENHRKNRHSLDKFRE